MDVGMCRIGSLSSPETLAAQNGFILGDRLMWEGEGRGGRGTVIVGRGGEVQIEKKPSKPVKAWASQRRHEHTMDDKTEKNGTLIPGQPGEHHSKHKRARVQPTSVRHPEKSGSEGQTEGWQPQAGGCHLMVM